MAGAVGDDMANSQSQIPPHLEFENKGLSTQRSGEPYNLVQIPGAETGEACDMTPGTSKDGGTGPITTTDNAVVPYNEDRTTNREGVEGGGGEMIPDEMIPLMEEMESVLYSISFGK